MRQTSIRDDRRVIRVIDERGTELESTYEKRAKGLVKKGRARFVNDHTICMARPPKGLEEGKVAEYTLEYALLQLEKVQAESQVFSEKMFRQIESNKSGGPGDVGAQGNAEALAAMSRDHEATNQRLIEIYQKMVDDLKPVNRDRAVDTEMARERFLRFVEDNATEPDYEKIWKIMNS